MPAEENTVSGRLPEDFAQDVERRRSRETVAEGKAAEQSQRHIFLNKARWGRDGGLGGKGNTFRASSDRMAAAGRARCDEGSYGHRQQR